MHLFDYRLTSLLCIVQIQTLDPVVLVFSCQKHYFKQFLASMTSLCSRTFSVLKICTQMALHDNQHKEAKNEYNHKRLGWWGYQHSSSQTNDGRDCDKSEITQRDWCINGKWMYELTWVT